MTAANEDRAPMARALELAARGLYTTDPNPRVGCVLVRDGTVIGEGWHERAGEAHAEVAALRDAPGGARGATAFVTLEPCSHTGRTGPCADALIAAGVSRVVCSSVDPNPKVSGRGLERLKSAGIPVSVGMLDAQARALNPGYFSRFERGRPLIRLKLAMSLDGRTAPAPGAAAGRWISAEASRADVQHWRARSSAVLTGAGTVRADDPQLNVRLRYGPFVRQPLRVVLDPLLTCPRTARVFDGGALVFAADGAGFSGKPGAAVTVERVPAQGRALDLYAVVARLTVLEMNELLVECGATLAAAFLEAQLVDELILYVAPVLLGVDAAPLAALSGSQSAAPFARFVLRDVERIDADLRLTLTPKGA